MRVKTHQGIMLLIRNYHRSHLNFFGSCLILSVACIIVIEANEVVPNDPSSSNQQAPVYHQQASSSLTNFNWLPGADTPTQYASDSDTSPSYDAEEDALLGEGSYSNRRKYRRKGNRKRVKGRKRQKHRQQEQQRPEYDTYSTGYGEEYESFDDDELEYYDRDDGYGSPKAPSYSAPAPSYEAPAPQYSAPSESYGAPSHSGGGDGFNDFLNALAAFLPIGLFLAAIPPNLITISTKKKRSLTNSGDEDTSLNDVDTTHAELHYPFLERISEIGYDKMMSDSECQKRLFCEMSTKGQEDVDANTVQKAFNYMVLLSPKMVSDYFGTTEVFRTIKGGNCSMFKC